MRIRLLPAGFIVPARPIMASRPPTGADWIHEIKRDGYRLIVRRDGPRVRMYSRNGYDLTAKLSAIAAAAERIKAKSFTTDGEAVVVPRRLVPIRGSAPTGSRAWRDPLCLRPDRA